MMEAVLITAIFPASLGLAYLIQKAALAALLREELLALVLKRKATTLIVTHDVEEAIAIADRILVLSPAPGRLIADRTIEAPRGALTEARIAKLKDAILSDIANASS